MKLTYSLKKYIVLSLLMTSTVLMFVLSGVAIKYFFSGLDIASTEFLRSQAFLLTLDEEKPSVTLGNVTVAADWEHLPQPILSNFKEADVIANQLSKKIGGLPIISPPKYGYFVMKVVQKDQTRYVSMIMHKPSNNPDGTAKSPLFFYIILIFIGALSIFSFVLFIILRKVTAPVEKLKNWAKSLNVDALALPTPNFQYKELNTLADIVKSSLRSVQISIEREQRFLGYASHELRTPIAVTRTNAELLRKMIDKNINQEKQLEVLARIERAGLNMTDLTETLLWLNRQENKTLPTNNMAFGELITQIVHDLNYLLQGKQVSVKLTTDKQIIVVSNVLCRVIITNLIRNAFQHTSSGRVLIHQSQQSLSITNENDVNSLDELYSEELGFGLGLELTEKLINKYGWRYQVEHIDGGRCVDIEVITIDK